MGKYMKKGKIAGDVAVMEFSQSGIGVRTRAKTLALRQNPELSYLQLRSRRLEKPQFHPPPPKPPKQWSRQGNNSNSNNTGCGGGGGSKTLGSSKKDQGQSQKAGSKRLGESVASGSSLRGGSMRRDGEESVGEEEKEGQLQFVNLGSSSELLDGNGQGAVGIKLVEEIEENNLELDESDRGTRENAPCSLTRDLDAIGTPGSDVRSSGNRRRVREPIQRIIPTSREMDEFFATAELQQQMRFMEKYNFDVVNGAPLPGRYEWVRVHP